MYMRWHSEHGMEHLWAPQDSPVAEARRYGLGLTRRRKREKTRRRTSLWRYVSGKNVELMSYNRNVRDHRRAAIAISQLLDFSRRCNLDG